MKKSRQDELEVIYLAFAKPLYFYLVKLTGSDTMAEELVQETFYRATLSLDLYEGGQVKSWLFKVARHAYMDEWRKRKRWGWVPFYDYLSNSKELVTPYGVPEDDMKIKELTREVKDILILLPENYRSILYLREYQQFSYEELASTLDISLNQVKINMYRARQRFKLLASRLGKDFERGENDGME
ncbi:RNA polymerase [Bacillus sp. FJAT-22090]|uniref:sigma-70 family RNA polymerase sigma factor n=1 Tax=Bacillus sp. FJAT-22090 TaxID=1581038 RepID=UPI0006AD8823|nr:sigma-70 family RNA polymerase sigma factor [Bacillus sp. FJAT-22090]ALC84426.1 RNA polymerase [Bacillus sp. FJAT-22090]